MSTTAVQPKENKMGTMPINKLLLNMSLPMMIAMLIQALYNIIDSMFVAQISENALSAVSLAFPMQNFMIAVGTGTGVGGQCAAFQESGRKAYQNCKQNSKCQHVSGIYELDSVYPDWSVCGKTLFDGSDQSGGNR